ETFHVAPSSGVPPFLPLVPAAGARGPVRPGSSPGGRLAPVRGSGGSRRIGAAVVALVATVVAALAPPAHPAAAPDLPTDPPDDLPDPLDLTDPLNPACDPLDPAACLLPFPSDRWTVADPTTPTGRRVALPLEAMPRNVLGKPVDPTEWNRNDGFSPGAMLLT